MNDQQMIAWAEQAIRQYLNQRPDAADTLEGIHCWWVGEAVPSPALTSAALSSLEAQGVVVQSRKGRHTIWRRNPGQ